MKKIVLIIIAIIIIIPLIIKFGHFPDGSDVLKNTAKCIGEKATIYTSESCIYCKKQEKMFGDNYQYLNIVDCKEEPQKCIEADITGTPTWVLEDGTKLIGVQDIEELKEATNCA